VVAGNTGVILQNRGAYFSLDRNHPNRLEPGKIPLHTLIASMAKRDGKLWSVLGCMGADGQPQIQMLSWHWLTFSFCATTPLDGSDADAAMDLRAMWSPVSRECCAACGVSRLRR
jgi:hypothetical protein